MKNPYPHLLFCVIISLLITLPFYTQGQCTARSLPFTEDFSGTPLGTCTPTTGGWVGSTAASGAGWWRPNTNWAQGTAAPEIEAAGDQANAGATESINLVSPPMNTTGLSTINLSFNHSLYSTNGNTSGSNTLTIFVETSPNNSTWTQHYTAGYSTTASLTLRIRELRTLSVPVTGNETYIRFRISGALFKLWGWEIDDVVVSSPAPPPTITGFNPPDACAGSGVFVTITGTDFTGATAVAFNGVAAQNFTVDNANQITATLPNNATTGTITVTAPGGTATSAGSFVVNPIPVATATPASQTVCSGDNVSIALGSNVNGTTYIWSRTNSPEINAASSMPLNDSGNPSGTLHTNVTTPVEVVFTILPTANGCGGDEITATVTVSSAPAQPGNITGEDNVCNGGAYTYSVTPVSGATSYTWALPNGWAGTSTTESIHVTASAVVGDISVTAGNGCGSSVAQIFTVDTGLPPAQPGAITGADSFCTGGNYTYSITPVAGASSYTWSFPIGWSGTPNDTTLIATAGVNAGTISVSAVNGCGNSPIQLLSVYPGSPPAMPGIITGTDTVCNGELHTYSVVPVNAATSYTWTLPNGWSGTSATESINVTTGATGGTITVTANNACGSSAAQTFTVNTGLAPGMPGTITGVDTACSNTTNTFSVTPVAGASSYTWTLPNGWTGTSATESVSLTTGNADGIISVTANNGCGASAAQSKSITVLSAPPTPFVINGPDSVCSGTAVTYSVPAASGGSSYNWTLPNGWTGSSSTQSITATAGSSGGVISVSGNGQCGTSGIQTKNVAITTTAPQPGTISGPDSICSGGTATFSVSPAAGATSYSWTLPNGWSGTSTTESIDVTASASAGLISVTATGACGTSASQDKIVFINTGLPVPVAIAGPDSVCPNTIHLFSVSAVNGATSYNWTLPSGWSGSSTADTITVTAGSGAGVISVTASGGCGTSQAQNKTVTVAATLTVPGTVSGPATVCENSTNTFSISPVNGATSYNWVLPTGWSGSSTTTSIDATANATGGTIEVTAIGACGASPVRTKLVSIGATPATPGLISGPDSVCSATAATYTIAAVAGATSYTWTLPGGWSGTSTTTSINATAGSAGGSISVVANGACGSSVAQTRLVGLTATVATPSAISGPDSICSGSSATFSVAAVNGATSYTWTLPSGWTGTSATTTINAVAGTGSGTISITATGCGTSAPATKNVVVNALPQVSFIFNQGPLCHNLPPVNLSASPAGGAFSGTGITGSAFDPAAAGAGTHNVTYTYADNNGCTASASADIVVNTCTGLGTMVSDDLIVYPNPFTDYITVQWLNSQPGALWVTLTDLTGKIILTTPAGNGPAVNIGTSTLPKGIYLLQIAVGNKIKRVEKLTKL